MASTEAQKKASAKYDKENTVQISIRLNKVTDSDILEYFKMLNRQGGSRQGFIKNAIRRSIEGISSASIWMSDLAVYIAMPFDEDMIRKHVGDTFYGLHITFDPIMNEIHVTTKEDETLHRYKWDWDRMCWEDDEPEYIMSA